MFGRFVDSFYSLSLRHLDFVLCNQWCNLILKVRIVKTECICYIFLNTDLFRLHDTLFIHRLTKKQRR